MLCLSCQRYKSKAIHNCFFNQRTTIFAVFIMSKIQIESNSQHIVAYQIGQPGCVYHVKDTNRKQFTTFMIMQENIILLCLSCQRYKSKAIHNSINSFTDFFLAVFIMSKIQIESNSQPIGNGQNGEQCCVYHVKDTNRKQFTTRNVWFCLCFGLCLSCQRYKSKAIHNSRKRSIFLFYAVFIMSKIQIESNSQP